ncbi:MAG: Aliphatic amidase [Planctomycetes bacterium ADurb.Bin126]|nr:MAG: Aliphatic amidase [Planctomycetes bacterium ADurb.Bin126]HOD83992.1 carbon-nitrogen hydrolase family protein [Phycisphaerae bacterium]HQL73714.1 carbon-nitrogen hydrolase family protein [Phycisphaerae bacterium]
MRKPIGNVRVAIVKLAVLCGLLAAGPAAPADQAAGDGWSSAAPREEISPKFSRRDDGGRDGKGVLAIQAGGREGVHGCWTRTFGVTGGTWYRFEAFRKAAGVDCPRRCVFATIEWRDADGKRVPFGEPLVRGYLERARPPAGPEYPADEETSDGWTRVAGTYLAPPKATQARVDLYLLETPGSVEWSQVTFAATQPPAPRKVRLAAVHYRPNGGKTAADNCRQFIPLIAKAAEQKADLVVLGEVVPSACRAGKPADVAESVPGESTKFFADLARKHRLHIVLSLYERDKHLVYNTAVLLGPGGELIGKYRKVTLPTSEVESGVTCGRDYGVFQTALGKIGMMICYDGFFPEVARNLTANGAEIIAWPVWGCNPQLARARAIENHVYLVSSTYEPPTSNWMLSGVWSHTGDLLAQGEKFSDVVVAEVDLSRRTLWPYLDDFRAKVERHRP